MGTQYGQAKSASFFFARSFLSGKIKIPLVENGPARGIGLSFPCSFPPAEQPMVHLSRKGATQPLGAVLRVRHAITLGSLLAILEFDQPDVAVADPVAVVLKL